MYELEPEFGCNKKRCQDMSFRENTSQGRTAFLCLFMSLLYPMGLNWAKPSTVNPMHELSVFLKRIGGLVLISNGDHKEDRRETINWAARTPSQSKAGCKRVHSLAPQRMLARLLNPLHQRSHMNSDSTKMNEKDCQAMHFLGAAPK